MIWCKWNNGDGCTNADSAHYQSECYADDEGKCPKPKVKEKQNNCYYNNDGYCVNIRICGEPPTATGSNCNWDSKVSCTFSQHGAQTVCSAYSIDGKAGSDATKGEGINVFITMEKGDLNIGVCWISADGRLQSEWHRTFKIADERYQYLKSLGNKPSMVLRVDPRDIKEVVQQLPDATQPVAISQQPVKDKKPKGKKGRR